MDEQQQREYGGKKVVVLANWLLFKKHIHNTMLDLSIMKYINRKMTKLCN